MLDEFYYSSHVSGYLDHMHSMLRLFFLVFYETEYRKQYDIYLFYLLNRSI